MKALDDPTTARSIGQDTTAHLNSLIERVEAAGKRVFVVWLDQVNYEVAGREKFKWPISDLCD